MAEHNGAQGWWAVYGWDYTPYLVAGYDDEIDALRRATADGYKAAFVPYGGDFREAIREWEKK